ncbi:hypothetical protein PITCH_A1330008 [uncultured Desulfobacterium sp.]|uniref:Uncharacterized protein n=1 Tax=uncultured Desulfobacterium sp. TaxID=201089 RepID=A0A445MSH3_9BACT|nr:hypothetical protein PITCH_A1330008 [uncultured Desulfobacterium sp.]
MEWETSFEAIQGHESDIERLQPFDLEIFDENYEHVYVRAIVSKSPEKLPEGKLLWMQDYKGKRESDPWRIDILERLAAPYDHV